MKTYKIENIEQTIATMEQQKTELTKPIDDQLSKLRTELSQAWGDHFENIPAIKEAIDELQSSCDYGIDEYGEMYNFIRFYFDDYKNAGCLEELSEFLGEHGITIDIENDALLNYCGDDYIAINDAGEVFQYHDLLFDKSSYDDEIERNALIEKHMEKTGCYPGVFHVCDRSGHPTIVNTQPEK